MVGFEPMAEIKESEKSDSPSEDEDKVYELSYHLLPDIKENDIESEVATIKSVIEKNGGSFITEEAPKKIELAYTITQSEASKKKRFNNAHFGWLKFETSADAIVNIKEVLDKNRSIIRFLIINTVKESTLAPQRVLLERVAVETPKKVTTPIKKNEQAKEKKTPISDEELDRTIEELVVE
ncbi:30S ribosomal protein S6 [Patescibacteria group bacterium]|nr:30S ribosomal protein S6 [Patescibacteria group bacterium]